LCPEELAGFSISFFLPQTESNADFLAINDLLQ